MSSTDNDQGPAGASARGSTARDRDDRAVLDQVEVVVAEFRRAFAGHQETIELLEVLSQRLSTPLRVGVVGPVSGGKTTLVHALLGNVVAATGAGETTRLLTWFHGGDVEKAELTLREGRSRQIYLTDEGRLPDWSQLGGQDVAAVHVTLPTAPLLHHLTLVDTPGLFSLRDDNSARSRSALVGDETGSELDALLFLTTGQQVELDALTAFCAATEGQLPSSSNVVAVVSKVDQIGGSEDPLVAGRRKAARLKAEPQLRLVVTEVLPVIGLLAETIRTDALRLTDLHALQRLATDETASWSLMSAELLERASPPELLIERRRLVGLLGLHGLRLAVNALRRDTELTLQTLAAQLLEQSGYPELEQAVWRIFVPRADVLKADRALTVLSELCGRAAPGDRRRLRSLVEGCLLGATGQAVSVLGALRRVQVGEVSVPTWLEDLLLATAAGKSLPDLLGLGSDASDESVREGAQDLLSRLTRYVNGPLVPARSAEVAHLLRNRTAALLADQAWLSSDARHAVAHA